jgi:methionyl-tRNA formyltransferase
MIKTERAPRIKQSNEPGTYHRTRDVESIDKIDLDCTYTARDLINILRARTFPPYDGAYFETKGRRVYLRLRLEYAEESSNDSD